MELFDDNERIISRVLAWHGVELNRPRFGGTEFRLGRRIFGSLKGHQSVDVLLPRSERIALVCAGEAEPHLTLPTSGWITIYLHSEEDEERAVKVLRTAYDILKRDVSSRKWNSPIPNF